MVYKDPHDDEYYKKEILKLLRKKELIRSQMYKALGAKIKAEQLTRVLEVLSTEGKISCRTLHRNNYPTAWGVVDHPEQVKVREFREREKQAQVHYHQLWLAEKRRQEAKKHWLDYLAEFMVENDPEVICELFLDRLCRYRGKRAWLHSFPLPQSQSSSTTPNISNRRNVTYI